jgi:hypothetical protein
MQPVPVSSPDKCREGKKTTMSPNEFDLSVAVSLIKKHITSEETEQNRDLHKAIGLIVDVARRSGIFKGSPR